jgi:hypothetical protein
MSKAEQNPKTNINNPNQISNINQPINPNQTNLPKNIQTKQVFQNIPNLSKTNVPPINPNIQGGIINLILK